MSTYFPCDNFQYSAFFIAKNHTILNRNDFFPILINHTNKTTTSAINVPIAAPVEAILGINAAFKLGLPRINKDLLDYVGRLKYRTSYGQNALDHCIQVAYLTGIMASELGLDQNLAKRAGLLHDIGKAADFELEGSHVEIGSKLAKKYGEGDVVINAIESHHGDVEANCIISHLVSAADTLSAARPGARREIVETYVKRLNDLENIAMSFPGVIKTYALQAGRELRVIVGADKITDKDTELLSFDLAKRIQDEMTYPGQIKITVIRETRAVSYAK